jgi:RND family efflux transporter MFP subunit
MKKWIVVVLVLATASAVAYKWPTLREKYFSPTNLNPTKTAPVESKDIQFTISAAGDIGPADQVSVRPEINGRIDSLRVDIGDKVKKGDVLFTLNDKDLQTERASRLTEIDGAKLELDRAKRNFERAEQLHKDQLISQELYEDTRTNYELAKNALDRAQRALEQVEEQLTKTKIMAPFDCTILTRPVSIGQAVSGSGGFNSGTEVLTIANLNEMIINAHINQADVTRLKVGMPVDIEVEAIPGLKVNGAIERLAPQATVRNGIKGFATRIMLKNVDERVRPGMTANVSIPIASASNVLAVPLAAIYTEEGERYVYVKKGSRFERTPVQIGIADFFYAEVQKGLSAGEEVALEQPPGVLPNGKEEGPVAPGGKNRQVAFRGSNSVVLGSIALSTNRLEIKTAAGATSTNLNNPPRRVQ